MGHEAMSASAFPKPSLRPYLASDLPLLSEIRFAAIEELTGEDYDEAQRRAWASKADDEEAFSKSLEIGLTVVALIGGHFLPVWLSAVIVSYLGLFRYEWSHFLIHTPYVPKTRWYRSIWRNHRLHHYKHEGYWLGITSKLGDRVLLVESRPMSKDKRWRVEKLIERAREAQ